MTTPRKPLIAPSKTLTLEVPASRAIKNGIWFLLLGIRGLWLHESVTLEMFED